MTFTADDVHGRHLHDADGRKVGRVTAFYRYPQSLDTAWHTAAVTRGRFFPATYLVDLRGARLDGDVVTVPHDLETIRRAPSYQAMIGDTLSEPDGLHVLSHYRGA